MRVIAQGLLIALLLPGFVLGQEGGASPSVTVEVNPLQATVGERLQARITLLLPAGWEADTPDLAADFGPFSVTSGSWQAPVAADGETKLIWSGQLSAFKTGDLQLPALAFELRNGQHSSTLRSAPVDITILSTLEDDEPEQPDIADLKGPLSIPAQYGPLIRAAALLALLLAASALAWWLHRRYALRLAAAAVPQDPFHRMAPHLWVYKALQELLDKRLEEQGLLDLFYGELAWILKRYAGGRYRLDLLEKTTAEVPDLLRQAGAPERAVQKICGLLLRCDEVKFARSKPGPEARRAAVDAVYDIVDATKPAEVADSRPQRGAA